MGVGRRQPPSPTFQATRSQGSNSSEDRPMGGPRTAEPTGPQQGTAADDGSTEDQPRHTSGTNGARPEYGALARRKYGLLALAGTAVDQVDAGDTGRKAGHGATADQDGKEPEEEGDKTLQRTLPARGNDGVGDIARGPPERLCTLNACGR